MIIAMILIFGLILLYDYKEPDCVEAQTCIAMPPENPSVYSACIANQTTLGCWDFCAVHRLYGIDDNWTEGFELWFSGSCGGGRRNWSVIMGGDVDSFGACCFNFNW